MKRFLPIAAVVLGLVVNSTARAGEAGGPAAHESGYNQPDHKREILYYRNPMGLADTSPVPKKDSMGMDYIPVYKDEDDQDGSSVKISLDRVQRAGVRTEPVEKRRLVRQVRAPAVVKFDERRLRSVALRADAFVEKLYVNETGKTIKAGEPLFRIYSPQIVSAQVDYRVSAGASALTRNEALHSNQGAEQRLRNLDVPETVIGKLRASGGTIMSFDWPSPATGVVIEKRVIEGQQLKTGDEAFRIADLDVVWVIAEVAEHDLGLVKVGAPAMLTFHAFADKRVQGKVTFIAPMLDSSARTGKVRIEAPNPDHSLRAEMYADVEIDAGATEAPRLAAPVSAVIDDGRHSVVLVARGEGRFEPRNVKLGNRADGYVEVKDGLTRGERVVVSANFLIDAESNLKAALKSFTADAPGASPAHQHGKTGDRP